MACVMCRAHGKQLPKDGGHACLRKLKFLKFYPCLPINTETHSKSLGRTLKCWSFYDCRNKLFIGKLTCDSLRLSL